jgi:hypothetical protein
LGGRSAWLGGKPVFEHLKNCFSPVATSGFAAILIYRLLENQ